MIFIASVAGTKKYQGYAHLININKENQQKELGNDDYGTDDVMLHISILWDKR